MQYVKENGKKGFPTYKINGRLIYSAYDPFEEARKFLGSYQNLKKAVITCCGADFINCELLNYEIDEILSIEPVIFDSFSDSDKIKRFEDAATLKKYLSEKNIFDCSMILWKPFIESDPDFLIPLLNDIKDHLKKTLFSHNTEYFFTFIESKNFLKNIRFLESFSFIKGNRDKLKNPALVISSGFSLFDNMDFIKEIKEYCHTFALPSSLQFLQHNGFEPDFAFAIDPGYATYYHLSNYKRPIKLITSLTLNPSIFSLVNIQPLFFNYGTFLENIFYEGSDIATSIAEGTAFMNLLRVLRKLGFEDIILVGQDFGFKEGMSHIHGGCFEKEFISTSGYFKNIEHNVKQLEASKQIVYINDGEKNIKTETSFSIYYNHFMERQFDFNIHIPVNAFNKLRNKYPVISARQIIGKNDKKNELDFLKTSNLSDIKTKKTDIYALINSMLNRNNAHHIEFMDNIGFISFSPVQRYILNKYSEHLFDN